MMQYIVTGDYLLCYKEFMSQNMISINGMDISVYV